MLAKDVMSKPVVSVGPETPVSELAALLADRRISGVPVLEDGRLVGVVNETDLLHRHEIGTEQAPVGESWLNQTQRTLSFRAERGIAPFRGAEIPRPWLGMTKQSRCDSSDSVD